MTLALTELDENGDEFITVEEFRGSKGTPLRPTGE